MKFILKGIQKSRRRPIIAGELGTLLSLEYYSKDNPAIPLNVKEISPENRFDKVKSNLFSTLILYLFLELIEKTIPDGVTDKKAFHLLYNALEGLEKFGSNLLIIPFFKYKLLLHLGLVPTQFHCTGCGSVILEKKAVKLIYNTLETFCPDCDNFNENDIDIIYILKGITHSTYEIFLNEKISENYLLKINKILDKYIIYSMNIEIKSSDVLYKSLEELKQLDTNY